MEATLDQQTADAMDAFYRESAVWDETAQKKLQHIVSNGRTKIVISRNERKAKKLKGLLKEYFFEQKN